VGETHRHRRDLVRYRCQSCIRCGAHGGQQSCTQAIASAATAYVVDYHLTPPRLRPGFEKHVSPSGMVAVYAAFAAGLAIAGILRDRYR
jgi:hypothetical protein